MENEVRHTDPMELLPNYFAGELSSEERSVVDLWRSQSAANQQEFDSFARLWDISGSVDTKQDIDLEREWRKMESVIAPGKTRTIIPMRILRIAASFALLFSLSWLAYHYTSTRTEETGIAEIKSVELPDGSLVSLNAGSEITYKRGFGKQHRRLILKGEAYFEVTKNAGLPFIISAGDATIQVVGTRFNVKAYKGQPEVKVLVTEGKVMLFETSKPEKETILTAGEAGSYDKSLNAVKKQNSVNSNDIAWKTRIMDFNATPLEAVAEVLRNTYHVDVVVDPTIKDCPITVHFEQKDIGSVLTVLRSTLDLEISVEGQRITISGKGC